MPEESINLDDLDDIYEEPTMAEPFIEDSALIQCGRLLSMKAKESSTERLASGGGIVVVDDITDIQKAYLNAIADGTSNKEACKTIGIDPFLPSLWGRSEDKDGVYAQCYGMIMESHAKELEEVIRKEAISSPRSALLKMFYMKAWDDKYKDNAPVQTNLQTNIHVTISDQQGNTRPYVVDTGMASEEIKRG